MRGLFACLFLFCLLLQWLGGCVVVRVLLKRISGFSTCCGFTLVVVVFIAGCVTSARAFSHRYVCVCVCVSV